MTKRILTISLPIMMVGALQLVSCNSKEIPPPEPGGAYVSLSAGASFEQSSNIVDENGELVGYLSNLSLRNIHRPEHDSSLIYVTAGSSGVYLSKNNGQDWRKLNIPLPQITSFVHLANGTWLAAGTNDEQEGIVIRSLDDGESWNKVLTIPAAPKPESKPFEIIKPPKPPVVFVSSLVANPFHEDKVYATTSTGEVIVGEESGKLWYAAARIQGKKNPLTLESNAPIRRVIPSLSTDNEFYLVSSQGTLVYANEEVTQPINVPAGQVLDISFAKKFSDVMFVSTSSGFYITKDKGENWDELTVPISKSAPLGNAVVRVSPTNPSRLFISVNNIFYRSENGGKNWNTLSLDLPNHFVTDISIDSTNAARVILITAPTKS